MSTAARHAEIARRYRWHAERQAENRAPLTMTSLRVFELESLFRDRFGGRFPNSRAGLEALILVAAHHLQRNEPDTVEGWIASRAPWTRGTVYPSGIIEEAQKLGRLRLLASELGWRVKLTSDERRRLKIRTIRAVGQTDDSMAEDRRKADRERKQKKRLDDGATPRAESLAATRPWERLGMSKRTWYRKGKPMPPAPEYSRGTDSSAVKIEILIADLSLPLRHPTAPLLFCALSRADQRKTSRLNLTARSAEPNQNKSQLNAAILP